MKITKKALKKIIQETIQEDLGLEKTRVPGADEPAQGPTRMPGTGEISKGTGTRLPPGAGGDKTKLALVTIAKELETLLAKIKAEL